MKWVGLALLVLGVLLAMDHRNWFMPMAFAVIILGYWYFIEREPHEVPPEEADYLRRDQQPACLEESSTSLDLVDLVPFLQRLSLHLTGGFGEKVIGHIADLSGRMKHEEERSIEYEVVFQGNRIPLNIGLFKDDIEQITIRFHTAKPLADLIDTEMEMFFAERGM